MKNSNLERPDVIPGNDYRFDFFDDGKVMFGKVKHPLPAMGWNSWNAFGSGNNEDLTKQMADKMVELGLDKLGYEYLVLDDGCYKNERVDGKLSNNDEKFPSGFRALADYIHAKGLKFGMYNDIGTNLCAGAAVGTCGHEFEDAASYVEWDVDFLKVDNCYYLWDNATFSDKENAKYVFAPAIAGVEVIPGGMDSSVHGDRIGNSSEVGPEAGKAAVDTGARKRFTAGVNMFTEGDGVNTEEIDGKVYFTHIGTFDGTGPARTPVPVQSGEVCFDLEVLADGEYTFAIDCICGCEEGRGSWLQIAAENDGETEYLFDDMLSGGGASESAMQSSNTMLEVTVNLRAGKNKIRLMNHRRQENTYMSYAKLLEGLMEIAPDKDIVYSLCEWGKTQPQNWAKKLADSWRILNDITFCVGADGDPGKGPWTSGYSEGVATQYNKAVIMDEFAGLDKGWNDPDMMVIGMNGMSDAQNRTHMAMWCMMNSPLMLGLDLRRVEKGDALYQVIANKALIDLNQDKLGVQAKRVYCSLLEDDFDTEYVTNNDRVDILAKPLADGSVALSFINVSGDEKADGYQISVWEILQGIGDKLPGADTFADAEKYEVTDLWTGEKSENEDGVFSVDKLAAYENVTVRVAAVN